MSNMKVSCKVSVTMIILWMVVTQLVCMVNGRPIMVGGKSMWNEHVNYTVWASQETFLVGDWLAFYFDKQYYDVLQVNETNYESCNADNFIHNVTRGGRDYFQLTEAKPYYFICSKGYCFNGMKVAINVSELPAPAPAPEGNNAASTLCDGKNVISILAVGAAVLALLAKV